MAEVSVDAKFRKRSGKLNASSSGISFVENGGNAILQLPATALRSQFVSAAGHSKIMLRLVAVQNPAEPDVTSNFTFSFSSLEARELIKSTIVGILSGSREDSNASTPAPVPSSSGISAADFELRKALLKKHKWLAQLHQNLVLSGAVSEHDFWERRKALLNLEEVERKQKRATSGSWLAELRPMHNPDGADVKYTLTPQIINAIFLQHPSVKRAYDAHVPSRLTSQEFWRRYLSSTLFHKSRNAGTGTSEEGSGIAQGNPDPIFDKCMEEDEEELRRDPLLVRPRFDLLALDKGQEVEDYGNNPDMTMRHVTNARQLLRRFNRQSELILQSGLSENKVGDLEGVDGREEAILLDDLDTPEADSSMVLHVNRNVGAAVDIQLDNELCMNVDDGYWFVNAWMAQLKVTDGILGQSRTVEHECRQSDDTDVRSRLGSKYQLPSEKVLAQHSTGNELLRHFWAEKDEEKRSRVIQALEAWEKQADQVALRPIMAGLTRAKKMRS